MEDWDEGGWDEGRWMKEVWDGMQFATNAFIQKRKSYSLKSEKMLYVRVGREYAVTKRDSQDLQRWWSCLWASRPEKGRAKE
jgi:hypothetical protein